MLKRGNEISGDIVGKCFKIEADDVRASHRAHVKTSNF